MNMHGRGRRFAAPVSGLIFGLAFACGAAVLHAQAPESAQAPMNFDGAPGGVRQLEEGQPFAMVHPTVEAMQKAREAEAHEAKNGRPVRTKNLSYHATPPHVCL